MTGLSVYNQQTRDFEFRPGPVFANILLVDEINRAMPKTQSALLEAMAERQVTVDGVTRALPDPFLVMATENPIEQEGTFPLPEAQLDRFFLKTELGYPSVDEEIGIVREQRAGHPLDDLKPGRPLDEVRELEGAVEDVYTDELLLRWIVELVTATRELEEVALGASVRASLALERTARAWALLHGRDYVTPRTSSCCSTRGRPSRHLHAGIRRYSTLVGKVRLTARTVRSAHIRWVCLTISFLSTSCTEPCRLTVSASAFR